MSFSPRPSYWKAVVHGRTFNWLTARRAIPPEAKQAALDEAHKFKNQFRALDEDEIEFLDGVKAAQRAEEQRVRRETEQGLEAFRAAQKKSETEATAAEDEDDAELLEDSWLGPAGGGAGRKRRRERERDKFKRVKRRASGPQQESPDGEGREEHDAEAARPEKLGISSAGLEKGLAKGKNGKTPQEPGPGPAPAPAPTPVSKPKAGLVDYGSSDDDDD